MDAVGVGVGGESGGEVNASMAMVVVELLLFRLGDSGSGGDCGSDCGGNGSGSGSGSGGGEAGSGWTAAASTVTAACSAAVVPASWMRGDDGGLQLLLGLLA